MSNKQIYQSGAPWESIIGYSRAVRVGNVIEVTGTTAIDANGKVICKGDAYGQTKDILAKIETSLKALGAGVNNVVRTRIFVRDIAQWQEIGKAHGEVFATILPATSMIQISGLIDPDMLVEIEATAIITD